MDVWEETVGVALLWLSFVILCLVYAIRIAALLYRQQRIERFYRARLAASLGAQVRALGTPARSGP